MDLQNEPIVLDSDESDLEEQEDEAFCDDRPPSDVEFLDDDEEYLEKSSDDAENDTLDSSLVTNNVSGTVDISEIAASSSGQKVDGPEKLAGKKSKPKNLGDKKKTKQRKKNFERKNIRVIKTQEKLDAETLAAQKEEEERKKRLAERTLTQPEENSSALKSLLTDKEKRTPAVVELLSSDEDDDCFIIEKKDDGLGEESDPENSGIHVDDTLNQPDSIGRVLANIRHPDGDPNIYLAPQIARAVKPHQIGGIRFLYDNIVESLSQYKESQGFGCILAHSMGLGKTLQVVGFVDVFVRATKAERILIIVPVNTLQNWINEFDMWLPSARNVQGISTDDVVPRSFTLHVINDTHKTVESRAKVIESWTSVGGVLLLGYEMFRLLATCKAKVSRKRKLNGPEVIDIDQEERNDEMKLDMQQALLDPGPDLVICDEGHRIKNSGASISKSLKAIHTRRRVVLTGYPLQNNLIEYWCMVDFVRPNFLGTRVEFSNMFERPITNGQCIDSTPSDVKLMRYRAHVLHSLLEGFVQRRNHKVLMQNLPPKQEWVLMVRMSPFQRTIYNMFMENLGLNNESCIGGSNPLKAFSVACKIWNHPDVLHKFLNKQTDNDLEMDMPVMSQESLQPKKKIKKSASEPVLSKQSNATDSIFNLINERSSEINYDWVKPAFENYKAGVIENSGKFVLLLDIIEQTLKCKEKLLVFSQSLITLNLLEEILSVLPIPYKDGFTKWCKNTHYYRLDGSTSASEREKLINQFNCIDNRDACLFLISTKAGCLGINLIGANRVVMLDASWNPCHDCQAVCRVYRYGQGRPCYIYRFVTDNTMEKKIYDRQVSKQGMADRVVDEIQVQNQQTKKENDQLLEYQDKELPFIDSSGIEQECTDTVLVDVIKRNHYWITQNPFTHESLLVEQDDQRLTMAEKRYAKEAYEREKKLNVTFCRQSYANYYGSRTPQQPPMFRGPTLPPMPTSSTPALHSYSGNMPFSQPVIPFRPSPMFQQEIRPGVSLQMIQAPKDIIAPGPEVRVIKKGEMVAVIRTPKGIYIKLSDGKIFAVRNRHEAENFGLTEASHQPITDSNEQLNSFLHAPQKQFAPNLVSRRRQQYGASFENGHNGTGSQNSNNLFGGGTDAAMPFTQPYQNLESSNMYSNNGLFQSNYKQAYNSECSDLPNLEYMTNPAMLTIPPIDGIEKE